MLSRIAIATGAALALLCGGAAQAQPTPAFPTRLTISSILVSNGQSQVDSDLRAWSTLLSSQLSNMLSDRRYNLANAQHIRIGSRFEDAVPNVAALDRRWSQTAAIGLIAATGISSPNGTVMQGSIYLGSLRGDLPSAVVPLRQTIKADEYQVSRDVVALATLYALAVDAGSFRSTSCPLLNRARSIRDDLRGRNVDVDGLSAAIDQRLAASNCRITQ